VRQGGILGALNTPNAASASGVWTLDEVFSARLLGDWPAAGFEIPVQYILAAGGGGGGSGTTYVGGGGAGGLIVGTMNITEANGTFSLTIGAGGAVQSQGGSSSFGAITAIGGGFGASTQGSGGSGGSGGGASVYGSAGSGTVGQGSNGGPSSGGIPAGGCVQCHFSTHPTCVSGFSGGGGGAGGVGTGVLGTSTDGRSPGGPGLTPSLPNYSSKAYSAGGDGERNCYSQPGGSNNTGNGGGAYSQGGSGEIVVVYPSEHRSLVTIDPGLAYTYTNSGGYKRYIFTSGTGNISWL
jgi:hypothetical protein